MTIGTLHRACCGSKASTSRVAAQKILRERGYASRLLIAGDIDSENAATFTQADLARWRDVPGVELLGKLDDVRALWRQAGIGVLPSRGGEGIPMSLLEAAACARPLVATDVPGCREIVRQGVNGTLVPVDDANALALALAPLLGRRGALRERYGAASRALVESDLAADAGRPWRRLRCTANCWRACDGAHDGNSFAAEAVWKPPKTPRTPRFRQESQTASRSRRTTRMGLSTREARQEIRFHSCAAASSHARFFGAPWRSWRLGGCHLPSCVSAGMTKWDR